MEEKGKFIVSPKVSAHFLGVIQLCFANRLFGTSIYFTESGRIYLEKAALLEKIRCECAKAAQCSGLSAYFSVYDTTESSTDKKSLVKLRSVFVSRQAMEGTDSGWETVADKDLKIEQFFDLSRAD